MAAAMSSIVNVLTINPKLPPLSYTVPEGMVCGVGTLVMVPLASREIAGVVWDIPLDNAPLPKRLKPLHGLVDLPTLAPCLMQLIAWVADYYVDTPAAVLRMVLASGVGLNAGRRRKALVAPLIVEGGESVPQLNGAQQQAAADIIAALNEPRSKPIVLDGVTGSGKTEVYFEAIAAALAQGKQALVLLPEIALTTPFLARFAARFGHAPTHWHSHMTPAQRRDTYRAIAQGQAKVVVGARSALFLPYPKLGLIVVDEAHETSFKQEDGVSYHARDVAVMRAHFERLPIILATATPALETRLQVEREHYQEIKLPARFGGAQMPAITAIDMLKAPPLRGRWLAPPLIQALEENVARREQSLLFLNRRGYAPLTLCRTCGHRFQCPQCTAWMVEHRQIGRLQCHHCGHIMPPPRACPECADEDSLVACGPGVERIADEVAALFPDARLMIATSDTLTSADQIGHFVSDMTAGNIDIVIGTQLVTKGYHFPSLTLVGVVDADLGLQGGDLRAAERCFQQISQVAGRAGRAEKPGRVMLQTREPDAPVIQALLAGEAAEFYAAEAEARRAALAPPYGRYAALIISSEDFKAAQDYAARLKRAAPHVPHITIFGPAPAPLAMLRKRHRIRLLVQAARSAPLQPTLRAWLSAHPLPRNVRLQVDVDPYSFV